MTPLDPGSEPLQPEANTLAADEQKEWIYRGIAIAAIALLLWVAYYYRYAPGIALLLMPFVLGAAVAAMRISAASDKIHAISNWLNAGLEKARASDGKFARFVKRPFYRLTLAIWRWTEPIPDSHARAALRLATLILITAVTVLLVATAAYIIIAIVVILLVLALIGWFLSLNDPKRPPRDPRDPDSDSPPRRLGPEITRFRKSWTGKTIQEHSVGGVKTGESVYKKDWAGRDVLVRTDNDGNKVSETRAGTTWTGENITRTTDTDGNLLSTGHKKTTLLGDPITVHEDLDHNVIATEHMETTWTGEPRIVREEKED